MTALHNRALALKLAVENLSEDALYVDGDAVDQATIDSVIQVADQFVAYLGADEPNTEAGTPAPTTEDAPAPAPAPRTGDEIVALIRSKRSEYGSAVTDLLLSAAGQLRSQPLETAARTAISTLPSYSDRVGASVVTALTREIRLLTGEQTAASTTESAAPAAPSAGRTGSEIITVLERYRRNYGSVVEPLISRAQALRDVPLAQAKETAVVQLNSSDERRSYRSQVDALIADIRAL